MTAPEDQNGLREALASGVEAEALEGAEAEAELMAGIPHNPAPPPIPVRGRYFLIECEHCGWVGSSEQGGTLCGDWGDSDVYCPVCDQTMLCDGPNEADTAKHGQSVFDRIMAAEASLRAAEAEITRLKEGMEARERANDCLTEMVEKLVLNATTGSVPHAIIVAAGDLLDTLSQERPHG